MVGLMGHVAHNAGRLLFSHERGETRPNHFFNSVAANTNVPGAAFFLKITGMIEDDVILGKFGFVLGWEGADSTDGGSRGEKLRQNDKSDK